MDNDIRSKRILTATMLHDFDLAYSEGSASSANWLIDKLKIAKNILRSGKSIEVLVKNPFILSDVQVFDQWVCERFPDYSDDV